MQIRLALDLNVSRSTRRSPHYDRAVNEVLNELQDALSDEAVQGTRGLAELAVRKAVREAGSGKYTVSLPVASGALRRDYERAIARGIPYDQHRDIALIVGRLPYSRGMETGWYIEDAFGRPGTDVRLPPRGGSPAHMEKAARAILRNQSDLDKLAVQMVTRVTRRLRREARGGTR